MSVPVDSSLQSRVIDKLGSYLTRHFFEYGELTIEIDRASLLTVAYLLRDDPDLKFEMLMDACGVDYLHYGVSEWETTGSTSRGFERGVSPLSASSSSKAFEERRFAVVYHLLSITHGWRLRLRVYLSAEQPMIDSVTPVWASANWYEREAFDLFGILFENHPDLRRILTDYGFVGHPFRKDFPLIGEVAMRYDAKAQRVIYEPVDIEARTLVPKVIREASS